MEFLDLLKKGQHTAIVSYVKKCKCLSIDEEVALIRRGNHEEIMSYITHHWLDPDGYEELLSRGNRNEIRFYISRNCLHPGSEDFLKLGGLTEVFVDCLLKEKLEKLPICVSQEEAQEELSKREIALLKSGDHCAIRRYIYHTSLTPAAYKVLVETGIAEDLLVYRLLYQDEYQRGTL